MVYITTLITVIVGVLGVLFSKQGDRAKLRPLGYVFIALAIISGALSALDAYWKSQSAAATQQRLVAENQRIQTQLNNLRLATYSVGVPPKQAIFILDYFQGPSRFNHKYCAGPFFPSFGATGNIGTIWFQFPDLFIIYGDIDVDENGKTATVRMMTPPKELPRSATLSKDPWYNEEFSPVYVVGAHLKEAIGSTSMRRIISELHPLHRLASISVNKPKDQAVVNEALAELHNISAYVKFYVDLRTKDQDSCTSIILLPLRFKVENDPDALVLSLYQDQSGLDFEECEKVPF